jgi:hypothetical protein
MYYTDTRQYETRNSYVIKNYKSFLVIYFNIITNRDNEIIIS